MTQEDARNFTMLLNSIVGYVPPMLMQQLTNCQAALIMLAVANGQLRLTASPTEQQGPTRPQLVPSSQPDEPQQGSA